VGANMAYIQNTGVGVVFVSWTQTGQPSASTIIELQPLSMITFAQEFGSGGITSLKISGADVFDAIITNDALVSDVATYTTSAPHSFAEGMLVSTAGLSNGSGIFNVTSQVITSIPTPTTFTIALFGNDVSFASDAGNAAVQAVPGLCVSYALLG
jgi:hypothetical protein